MNELLIWLLILVVIVMRRQQNSHQRALQSAADLFKRMGDIKDQQTRQLHDLHERVTELEAARGTGDDKRH